MIGNEMMAKARPRRARMARQRTSMTLEWSTSAPGHISDDNQRLPGKRKERSATAGTASEPQFGLPPWVNRPPELWNALLIGASVLYILGYGVWSLHAWNNNLGMLPAIQTQYFSAGIVPALIILAVALAVRTARRLIARIPTWERMDPRKARRWRFIMWGYFAGIILLFVVTGFYTDILFFVGLFFAPWAGARLHWFRWFVTIYLVATFALVGLAFYILAIYPTLPQELGGVRPRCAQLDVVKAQMSTETLRDLTIIDSASAPSGVVRTIKLDVLFAGSDFLLTRPKADGPEPDKRLYEIRKNVVQAVHWCDQRSGLAWSMS